VEGDLLVVGPHHSHSVNDGGMSYNIAHDSVLVMPTQFGWGNLGKFCFVLGK